MVPTSGIDWEGLTGKSMDKIDQDDINGVIVRKLIGIENNTSCVKDHETRLSRHDTYFKWFGVAIVSIAIPVILKLTGVF